MVFGGEVKHSRVEFCTYSECCLVLFVLSTVNFQFVFRVVKRNECNTVVAILEIHLMIWVFLLTGKFLGHERFICCLKQV